MQAIQLADLFQDEMVFQDGKPLCIFGNSAFSQSIQIHIMGQTWAFSIGFGPFVIHCDYQNSMNDAFDIELESAVETIRIKDCVFGDVFLLSGQSNMEFLVCQSSNVSIEPSDLIRYYEVPKLPFEQAETEFPQLYSKQPTWRKATKETIPWMSLIGYLVAKELVKKTNHPIGLIGCSMGDTCVMSWVKREHLYGNQRLSRLLNQYQFEVEKYASHEAYTTYFNQQLPILHAFYGAIEAGVQAGLEASLAHQKAYEQYPHPYLPMGPRHQNRPAGCYDMMLSTVIPFPLKSVLYYQGESDHQQARYYSTAFQTLIDSWRELFQDANLPFYFVQIAGYAYPGAKIGAVPMLRWEQQKCHKPETNQFMVTAIDLGEEDNIHPRDKTVLASRLLDTILEHTYGEQPSPSSPMIEKAIQAGNQIHLPFGTHQGSIEPTMEARAGITISIDGYQFEKASQVECHPHEIVVTVSEPIKEIRYLFDNAPKCNYYLNKKLPLLPFRFRF